MTLEAGIPGNVMWLLIDGKQSVSLPHQDGLFVDRVDDCLNEYYSLKPNIIVQRFKFYACVKSETETMSQ